MSYMHFSQNMFAKNWGTPGNIAVLPRLCATYIQPKSL